ncbi:hypothetical protein [Streptomyces tendae]
MVLPVTWSKWAAIVGWPMFSRPPDRSSAVSPGCFVRTPASSRSSWCLGMSEATSSLPRKISPSSVTAYCHFAPSGLLSRSRPLNSLSGTHSGFSRTPPLSSISWS